jgi:hypothetical protein
MALFEDANLFGGSWMSNVLIGVGVALVAPIIVPALAGGLRPLAKTVVKGGMMAYNKGMEIIAEANEQVSDLVAEVRSELAGERFGG